MVTVCTVAEDLSSDPSIYIKQFISTYNSSFKGIWPFWGPALSCSYSLPHTYKNKS